MAAEIITAKSLNLWYGTDGKTSASDRGHHALKDINVNIPARQITALIGPSGCGKSTLGRVILGLTDATSGSVLFDGEETVGASKKRRFQLRKDMQMIFQDPFSQGYKAFEQLYYNLAENKTVPTFVTATPQIVLKSNLPLYQK